MSLSSFLIRAISLDVKIQSGSSLLNKQRSELNLHKYKSPTDLQNLIKDAKRVHSRWRCHLRRWILYESSNEVLLDVPIFNKMLSTKLY